MAQTLPSFLSRFFLPGFLFGVFQLGVLSRVEAQQKPPQVPDKVTYYSKGKSPISTGVTVPGGMAYYWSSGIGAPLLSSEAPVGSPERYGDTKTQAIGVLNQIRQDLGAVGLTLQDVTYLRVYVAPDANKDNRPDFQGWFEAYAQFFNNPDNPVQVARSTVGVHSLVNPDWLIEIEAVAAYPETKSRPAAAKR